MAEMGFSSVGPLRTGSSALGIAVIATVIPVIAHTHELFLNYLCSGTAFLPYCQSSHSDILAVQHIFLSLVRTYKGKLSLLSGSLECSYLVEVVSLFSI